MALILGLIDVAGVGGRALAQAEAPSVAADAATEPAVVQPEAPAVAPPTPTVPPPTLSRDVPSEPVAVPTPVVTEPELTPLPLAAPEAKPASKPWYETIKFRGYTQFRFNNFPSFDKNEKLVNAQGDRSIGGDAGFLIRRARIVISGDVHEYVSIYLQPDFASVIGDQYHVAIMRDWYADIYLEHTKQLRLRVGQSKVPFGFENLQSSSNRLPLDRADPLNSEVRDERDLGLFLYWAPPHIRDRFKHLVDSGLKGSGDYGVIGVGAFNGQTANRFDVNGNFHVVARATWPFDFGGQFVELGVGGIYGKYRVNVVPNEEDGIDYRSDDPDNDLDDMRAFASVMVYPQPFGFAAEFNVGKGPQQGQSDPALIESRTLHGGYAQLMLKLDDVAGTDSLTPYVRGQYYKGGKKFEDNAPRYDIRELDIGVEWQVVKALEVTAEYVFANRTSSKYPYDKQVGQIARLQVQINY